MGLKTLAFAALLLPLTAVACYAQEAEHIETDRDSFTPATSLAGPGRLIVESAYSFIDNRQAADSHSFPELIGRYGVTDWLELRLGANYEVGGEDNSVSGIGGETGDTEPGEITTEAKVTYGFKAALTEQDGWIPQSAAILQGSTPTSGIETQTHLVATYVWGWKFGEQWTWDSAIRYGDGADELQTFNRWAPSTVLKYEFIEDWNAHIEYFGIYTQGRDEEVSQSYISPGVHHLITPNFEAGVRVGWGVSDDAANFFSNFGIGLRY